MNAVGIDVSKGKSMVAILRPFGEIVYSPFEIKHTSHDMKLPRLFDTFPKRIFSSCFLHGFEVLLSL